MKLEEIFNAYRTVAVYGMSTNPAKPSNYVPEYLMGHGYNIIPINPTASEISGKTAYPKIADIPDEIEILNVFRPSEHIPELVREAVERKQSKGDIKLIWLQEGIVSDEGRTLAEDSGIEFVEDLCMMKEHQKL